MTRVLALVPDLMFGSRVQGALTGAGHAVELIGDPRLLTERLADAAAPTAGVLVVDLTDDRLGGSDVVAALKQGGQLAGMRTLGFYSHVDASSREAAERAGFDLVVPRSRMAREGAQLVERLAGGPQPATQ
jgi:hypothetical protein